MDMLSLNAGYWLSDQERLTATWTFYELGAPRNLVLGVALALD